MEIRIRIQDKKKIHRLKEQEAMNKGAKKDSSHYSSVQDISAMTKQSMFERSQRLPLALLLEHQRHLSSSLCRRSHPPSFPRLPK
jgi:hypothetical protein